MSSEVIIVMFNLVFIFFDSRRSDCSVIAIVPGSWRPQCSSLQLLSEA